MTSEENRKALDAGVVNSLRLAGIRDRWINASLSDFPPTGPELTEWIMDGRAWTEIAAGRGLTLTGLNSRPVAMVLARALHVVNTAVFVVGPRKLLALCKGRGEDHEIERMTTCSALFVHTFFEANYDTAYAPYEVQMVEEVLRERLDSCRSLFVQSSLPLAEVEQHHVWSQGFLRELAEVNTEIPVEEITA